MYFSTARKSKGQALIEAILIMNIILFLFFAMLIFGAFIFDKIVVIYACNLAIDEAIGKIPLSGVTVADVELMMQNTALGVVQLCIFADSVYVKPEIFKDKENGTIKIFVQVRFNSKMPLVSYFLDKQMIEGKAEAGYSW